MRPRLLPQGTRVLRFLEQRAAGPGTVLRICERAQIELSPGVKTDLRKSGACLEAQRLVRRILLTCSLTDAARAALSGAPVAEYVGQVAGPALRRVQALGADQHRAPATTGRAAMTQFSNAALSRDFRNQPLTRSFKRALGRKENRSRMPDYRLGDTIAQYDNVQHPSWTWRTGSANTYSCTIGDRNRFGNHHVHILRPRSIVNAFDTLTSHSFHKCKLINCGADRNVGSGISIWSLPIAARAAVNMDRENLQRPVRVICAGLYEGDGMSTWGTNAFGNHHAKSLTARNFFLPRALAAEPVTTVQPRSSLPDQPFLRGLQCVLDGVESVIANPIRSLLSFCINGYDLQRDISAFDVLLHDCDCLNGISRNYFRDNHFSTSTTYCASHSPNLQALGSGSQSFSGTVERDFRGVASPVGRSDRGEGGVNSFSVDSEFVQLREQVHFFVNCCLKSLGRICHVECSTGLSTVGGESCEPGDCTFHFGCGAFKFPHKLSCFLTINRHFSLRYQKGIIT